MRVIEGEVTRPPMRVGIVVARFNEYISRRLLQGSLTGLIAAGVDADADVTVVWVPGAFEIPLIAKTMVESNKYSAIITLGSVIRGGTPHFDYVCNEVSRGVNDVSMSSKVPVIFGVLTTDTFEQAEARSAPGNNKGVDCAVAALQMASLIQTLGN